MKTGKTHRGFYLIEFSDRYNASCSLQKSSLASEDAIWFGTDDADPKILAVNAQALGINTQEREGWVPFLQKFAETGELL